MPNQTATVTGYREYTARQGDTYDLLALQAYGDERMAHIISQANRDMMDVLVFDGGESLRIPIVERIAAPETLPPWRR